MSSSKCAFLLISEPGDFWNQVLEDALAPLGTLQVAAEESAMDLIINNEYDAIIIVAGNVSHFGLLTSRIRAQRARARIIIVSSSLTWQRAREAFKSGASDYVFQSVDEAELLTLVKTVLSKPLTPWPQ